LQLKAKLDSYSISDEETRMTIKKVFEETGYLLDPHGAVGYAALSKFLHNRDDRGILLETAHPVKFYDVVEPVIDGKIPIPSTIDQILTKEKKSSKIKNSYAGMIGALLH